jgi:uncharacterized protein (DUF1501 family)
MQVTASSLVGLAASCVAGAAWGSSPALRTVVFVMLRGGADGLSLVVPYTEAAYYAARRRTAIAPPGAGAQRALDLDGRFGLHPQLAPLLPLFRAGELSITLATGLREAPGLHGSAQLAVEAAIDAAWGAPVERVDSRSFGTLRAQLAATARRLEQRPGSAFLVEVGGWDTHAAQGTASEGRLAERLGELGRELALFRRALGTGLERVTVVVLTEFGRTLPESPLAGTGDGGASLTLQLGDVPGGGRVLGRWPGLSDDALVAGRHLAVTTDLVAVLGDVAARARGNR